VNARTVLQRHGVYPAIVTDLVDRDGLGRIEISLPWLGSGDGQDVRAWARLVSPYADDDQGFEVVPEVGTEVVVAFEAGDVRRPYVLGAPWNGKESLPTTPDAANDLRTWRTRSGSELQFDDSTSPKVTLSMDVGHRLVLDATGAGEVRIEHSNGTTIVLTSSGDVQVNANARLEVNASLVEVHAPMARFDGVVQCETLVASTGVVSPSYTPGAGNVW
jgi:uncharacterized protein involved in type VI secretion and phage assembly